ncbi:MAG: TIGR03118 family protein [Acidobacteriota bacterium]
MRGRIAAFCLLASAGLGVAPAAASAVGFGVTYLASDQPGVAKTTDPLLINAWGLASSAGSPFWTGSNGSGTSELYNGAGVKQAMVVTIPGDGSVTGVVFSGVAGSFNGDTFLFDSEDGTISGWRNALGTNAEILQAASPSNVYKGLAAATISGNGYAYAANFRTGKIDVLKGNGRRAEPHGHVH